MCGGGDNGDLTPLNKTLIKIHKECRRATRHSARGANIFLPPPPNYFLGGGGQDKCELYTQP